MRASTTHLFKRQRLTRLGGETSSSLRVGKEMRQAVAQDHRRKIKHDRTVVRGTQLLELPPTTFHVLIVLFNLWTLFLVAHDP